MTSNIAAERILEETSNIGDFNREVVLENIRKNVLETLRHTLRPEFLNRIDETIVFSSLSKDEVNQIVRLQLQHLKVLLSDRDVELNVTDAAVAHIGASSYEPTFGARPIKRFINKQLKQMIAKQLLEGSLREGQTLTVDFAHNEFVFTATDTPATDADEVEVEVSEA